MLALVGSALAATGADQGVIVSLSVVEHLTTIAESVVGTAATCGGFLWWIIRTREKRAKEITSEISDAVALERTERESDVGDLEGAVSTLSQSMNDLRTNCARQEDIAEMRRLLEKHADKAEANQRALENSMQTMVNAITARLDRLAERRLAPRDGD